MAATAAAREETANAEAQLEQIAEALVRAEVSLSERDARCEDLRREVDVANGKAAAAEHRAAVAERGATAARAELGLALERVAKERTRAAAAESQLSSAKRLLAEASESRTSRGKSFPPVKRTPVRRRRQRRRRRRRTTNSRCGSGFGSPCTRSSC